MKIFITGASGFIGKHLINHFIKKKIYIKIQLRNKKQIDINNKYLEIIEIDDLINFNKYKEILKDVDCVIHLIARQHIINEPSKFPSTLYRETNVKITETILKNSVQNNVKQFIFMSSIKVNGNYNINSKPFKIDDIEKPNDIYGCSKLEAEKLIIDLSRGTNTNYTIIRSPIVYSNNMKGTYGTIMNLLSYSIPLPLKGLNKKRSMVNIINLVQFLELVLLNKNSFNEKFFISDDHNISIEEFASYIIKKIHKGKIFNMNKRLLFFFIRILKRDFDINNYINSYTVDISYTKKKLNWKPKYNFNNFI